MQIRNFVSVSVLKESEACIEKPIASLVDEELCNTLPRSQKEEHVIGYIAGYLVKKLRKEFRKLCNPSRVATTKPRDNWVLALSR